MKPRKPQTKMTDKIFFEICEDISRTSLSIMAACKKNKVDRATFYRYLQKAINSNDTAKCDMYARAREFQADLFFDKMISRSIHLTTKKKVTLISKEEIWANRLMIDTLKFAVAKLNPRKYSETLNVNTNENKLSHEDLLKRLNGD